MNYFALFHVAAGLTYIMLGFYILRRDLYSTLSITYSMLCALFSLWAFAFAFMHISTDINTAYFLYNVSAPGWCLFSGLSLHVMLLIADKKDLLRKWWLYLLIYMPGCFFLSLQWIGGFKIFNLMRLGPGFIEVPDTSSVWYWMYVAYQVIFIVYGLIMLVMWGLASGHRREKKQALVLVTSITATYILCFLTDIIFPLLHIYVTPPLSVIFILIFSMGTLIAIVRYQMFSISLAYASDEILMQIREVVAMLKVTGEVLKANRWTATLLKYEEHLIIGKQFCDFLEDCSSFNASIERLIKGRIMDFYIESSFIPAEGGRIPCGLTGTPVRDRVGEIIAVLVTGVDLTEKRNLQLEIDERIKTAEALRVSQEQIRARNEEIEQQLLNAQQIQSTLLPGSVPLSERVMIDYRIFTMGSVGGDYFSFFNAEKGSGVLIGDVSGHGVSAALFLALLKFESDRIAVENHARPLNFIEVLNKSLLTAMHQNYMTAIYGFFKWDGGNSSVGFTWSSGGHPYPVLYRSADSSAVFLKTGSPVLAVFEDAKYYETEIFLEKGDRIFLYTDGLPETRNNRGEMFGYDSLLGLIRESGSSGLAESLDNIVREVTVFRGCNAVEDDLLIIACEVI
jgi:PAS domain S-box-containing protein